MVQKTHRLTGNRHFVGWPTDLTDRKVRYFRIQFRERKIIILTPLQVYQNHVMDESDVRNSQPPPPLSVPKVLPNSNFLAEIIAHSSHSTLSILWSTIVFVRSILASFHIAPQLVTTRNPSSVVSVPNMIKHKKSIFVWTRKMPRR